MHMEQSDYSMGLEWAGFCAPVTKATTSSKGLTRKKNPNLHIFICHALYKTLYCYSSAG